MAKNLKLNIKNAQIAKALNVKGLKEKLASKGEKEEPAKKRAEEPAEAEAPQKRRVRARTKSAFTAEGRQAIEEASPPPPPEPESEVEEEVAAPPVVEEVEEETATPAPRVGEIKQAKAPPPKPKAAPPTPPPPQEEAAGDLRGKAKGAKEFRDFKPKRPAMKAFDSRDRYGLSAGEEEGWRRRRPRKSKGGRPIDLEKTIRPTELSIRLPISVKDLASAMKLKASELITKLFMQGVTRTLNDLLDDETTVQLLGHEFGCEITIDTSEAERIRITDKTIREEIAEVEEEKLVIRAPVVTFMGHVDHGKTSLIDRIRSSNVAAGEAGAITQHMGAFRCETKVGPITILDTPGHEAFTAMRARGAEVTDVVVLVVAGDEGIKAQTLEAIQHARAAGVTIVVAINKCDKPAFNAENVYRQLSEAELLPEKWGGSIVTVNCSAQTGEGIDELLEMIALQAEVLELKANPHTRARGTVLESEMHTGLGAVATILVQNGSLRQGDALVFGDLWGRARTMQDEHGASLREAGPSYPVAITGLSGLPEAGSEFIVVESEKVAREIAEARSEESRQKRLAHRKRATTESFLQQGTEEKKILNLVIRADVQGSLEALKASLAKIESDKASLEVIFSGVGAISESDVQLAMASGAVILGFHTQVESHAEPLIKQHKIEVRLHDVIYHAIDEVKAIMTGTLDKIAEEEERGVAEIRAVFKASQLGKIAGCLVTEGTIHRNHKIRLVRNGEVVWKGSLASIKREADDVREVKAGVECGILLAGQNDIAVGDLIQAYEVVYKAQEL
ncbi:MAG: translation initiation factor IF-2 [Parachlamydiales bacterium]